MKKFTQKAVGAPVIVKWWIIPLRFSMFFQSVEFRKNQHNLLRTCMCSFGWNKCWREGLLIRVADRDESSWTEK